MSTALRRDHDPVHDGPSGATLLIAPDSFKGTLAAPAVAAALARGVATAARPPQVVCLPLADGGEGTLEVLQRSVGGSWRSAPVRDPWGAAVEGRYLQIDRPLLDLPSPVAAVAWSSVAGFAPVRSPAQAGRADSGGVGQVLRAAREAGCRSALIALGGSATTDGGAGLLRELGARLLDRRGRDLPPGGVALRELARIDTAAMIRVPAVALADVSSPLLGPEGTAARFAPQKGADAEACAALEQALQIWAACADPGGRLRDRPGAGAAGGAGFGLATVLDAPLLPGAATLADLCDLDDALGRADRVWTGEGRVDGTTARGKVVAEVLRRARSPVDVVGGDLGPGADVVQGATLDRLVTLVDPPGAPAPPRWRSLGLPLTAARATAEPAAALTRLAARMVAPQAAREGEP